MTRDELLARLRELQCDLFCWLGFHDWQEPQSVLIVDQGHREADAALLAYIADAEITEAFEALERWYS